MRVRFWLATVLLTGGCHLIGGTDGLYIDDTGPSGLGGTGGTGGATGGGATSSSSTGGEDGQGGGLYTCTDADQCPLPEDDCLRPKCTEGQCEAVPATSGSSCDDNGGQVCDGEGHCVECNIASDCSGGACIDAICADPSCEDGVKGLAETDVDCGGDCPPCEHGKACLAPGDCKSTICTAGACVACSSHGQCDEDDYCEKNSTGYCVPKKGGGSGCDEGAECKSGVCWFSTCIFG